jgi:hypothetical protein
LFGQHDLERMIEQRFDRFDETRGVRQVGVSLAMV